MPQWNELTDHIAALCKGQKGSNALNYGGFKSLVLTNRQCVFERETESDRVIVAINADDQPYTAHFDARAGRATDLITGDMVDFGGGLEIPGYTSYLLQI